MLPGLPLVKEGKGEGKGNDEGKGEGKREGKRDGQGKRGRGPKSVPSTTVKSA